MILTVTSKINKMLKELAEQAKLILLIIYDLVIRFEKYIKFLWLGKHEFERICELPCDIYEKTMQLERWLMRSNNNKIRQYFDKSIDHITCKHTCLAQGFINFVMFHYIQPEIKSTKEGKAGAKALEEDETAVILEHIEDGDKVLVELVNTITDDFLELIQLAKKTKLSEPKENILRDMIYRIVSFNLSALTARIIANVKYDANILLHQNKLVSLWNNLVKADEEKCSSKRGGKRAIPIDQHDNSVITNNESIVSSRWSLIGFQGEDPGTDFRGMGLLGLEQLEYLSRKPRFLARDLLERSLNKTHEYPFAITGINITYHLLNLYKDRSMRHFYYDYGDNLFRNKQRNLNLIKTLNDLYVELFLRFDCFWQESKPENILAFNELMETFVNVIRMDLESRNFSMKFIY